MPNSRKILLKIVGLLILLVFLYFIFTLLFLAVYGTGGQASNEIHNGGVGAFLRNTLPLIVVGYISYRMFKSK